MPTSRFDQAVGQPYVSQYVPLPFNEISAIAKDYQHQYDAGRGLPSELDKLANALQATDYHQDYKNKVITKYHDDINKAMDEAKGNYASPDFQRKAMDIIYRFKNDKDVQTIQSEKKVFDNVIEKLKPEDINDFVLPNHQIEQGHLIKGSINSVPFAKHLDDAKMFTSDIIPDIKPNSAVKPYGNGTYMYETINGKHEYITKDRILALAKASTPAYGNTAGGRFRIGQFVRDYAPELGPQISKLGYNNIQAYLQQTDPKKSQMLDNYLAADIASVGLQKIHDKLESHVGLHNDPLASEKFKEENSTTVPVYNSPANTVPGQGISDAFDLNRQYAMNIPGRDEFGIKDPNAAFVNANSGSKPTYTQIGDMNDKTKEFAENVLKQVRPDLYKAYKTTGKLSEKAMSEAYPLIKEIRANLEKDLLVGSKVTGLNDTETKEAKNIFGSDIQDVKNLGTGLGVNATYYIPSTGEKLTYAELKDKFDSDSPVALRGKYSPTNPFVKLTGDKGFANAKQLSIDGTEIVMTGPSEYKDSKTGTNNPRHYELELNKITNDIYNSKFQPTLPQDVKIGKSEVKVLYMPDKQNPDAGTYNLLDPKTNKVIVSGLPSAEDATDFILKNQ